MLRSDLCDFRGSYIVVKGDIVLTKDKDRGFIDIRNRFLALKNNAPFVNFISKINNVLIGNLEDLDAVMPMYNLLEYSKNYWKRTSSLWNYYRDEPNNLLIHLLVTIFLLLIAMQKTKNSESFKCKSNTTWKTWNANQETSENTEQENIKTKASLENVVPLKYSSNFWRTLDMSLIDCEVSLTLT